MHSSLLVGPSDLTFCGALSEITLLLQFLLFLVLLHPPLPSFWSGLSVVSWSWLVPRTACWHPEMSYYSFQLAIVGVFTMEYSWKYMANTIINQGFIFFPKSQVLTIYHIIPLEHFLNTSFTHEYAPHNLLLGA